MKRSDMSKQGDLTWTVASGGRLLPASLRESLVSAQPLPRPAPYRCRVRRDAPNGLSLMPLSRRPVFEDR